MLSSSALGPEEEDLEYAKKINIKKLMQNVLCNEAA
jgi:hypothetical protein